MYSYRKLIIRWWPLAVSAQVGCYNPLDFFLGWYIYIYIYIIQHVKTRAILCPHKPPTRGDATVAKLAKVVMPNLSPLVAFTTGQCMNTNIAKVPLFKCVHPNSFIYHHHHHHVMLLARISLTLSPSVSIIHRFRKVFQATSYVRIELLLSSRW